jgi:hypothetical protein
LLLIELIINLITEHSQPDVERIRCRGIAEELGVSTSAIYGCIRVINRDAATLGRGPAILTIPGTGYVMAHLAEPVEQLKFLSLQNSISLGVDVKVSAGQPTIFTRWRSRTSEGRFVREVVNHLTGHIPRYDRYSDIFKDMIRNRQ